MLFSVLMLACRTAPITAAAPLVFEEPDVLLSMPSVSVQVYPWSRGPARGRMFLATLPPTVPLTIVPAAHPVPLAALLDERPQVAVNGGFYDASGAMGLVRSDGQEHVPLRAGGGSGIVVIQDGTVHIRHRSQTDDLADADAALQSIDRLVDAGSVLVSASASVALDARTGIGVRDDGTVLLGVIFDDAAVAWEQPGQIQLDADSSTTGVSLREWAGILAAHGATEALNLDGGYSTSMRVRAPGTALDVQAHRATINAVVATLPAQSAPSGW